MAAKAGPGVRFNVHIGGDGPTVFAHACIGSPYRSGRSRHWVKSENAQHPAVKREAEEDWTRCLGSSKAIAWLVLAP